MHRFEFRVRLEANEPCVPEVRAWVDLKPEADLNSETELCLGRLEHDWVGRFVLPASSNGYFLYRVGLAAHEGAQWTLSIREVEHDRELLTDSDIATLAKSWMVGTCATEPPSRSGGEDEPTRRGLVCASRRAHLVLLRGGASARSVSRTRPNMSVVQGALQLRRAKHGTRPA